MKNQRPFAFSANVFWLRGFFESLLLLSFGMALMLLPALASAQDEPSCSRPGFFSIPCDPEFQLQTKTYPDGAQEVLLTAPNDGQIRLQAIPRANSATLASLIQGYRSAFLKAGSSTPQESWIMQHGVRTYQMMFPGAKGFWITATRRGYAAVSATFKQRSGPVIRLLGVLRFEGRPIQETIHPPQAPTPSQGSSGGLWLCRAQGSMRVCNNYNGRWANCSSRLITGTAVGSTRQIAAITAASNCNSTMSRMIILTNISPNQRGQRGQGCVATQCSPP